MVGSKSFLSLTITFSLLLQLQLGSTDNQYTDYVFLFDNEDIFEDCPEMPDNHGIDAALSTDNLEFDLNEEYLVDVSGNSTVVWEGVQPSDRIEFRADMYQEVGGLGWLLTPFSLVSEDLCIELFEKDTLFYKVWGQHVPKDEQKCFNVFGHTYHYEPFAVKLTFDGRNLFGRYKIVGRMEAFDEQGVKRPKTICSEVTGEITYA
ncbi:uncharacterized protein LOC131994051 [Stomoxys calcitrans]|uniref:uncharacterized protein LOC131994051 n=1 Tax=Stomoxys calcitrans TaxID=35570 RepID=UPI0027E222A2|nr:uncharacterized protein LOC131994051 [Stomoxys calcitrans]